MPRSFDFTIESTAKVDDIRWAYSEENYWRARLAASGGTGRLDSFLVDVDESVAVVIVQDLRKDLLPGIAAKFYPRMWRMEHNETWRPIDSGLVRGDISIVAHGAPGSGMGTAVLSPARNGSCLTGTATVEFNVPFVGGQVESLIGRQLVQELADLQRFTAEWISENA
ncbi:DUF2505 domain-containing protein [Mycolicibacterium sp. BiH015]|uniref:DUF2505 domain-containing protein n=1 Tax=Mycolicibacterium sp. BiH015 TaxID=3018808 RepID=UPI0022DF1B93|nr:DUF2505 domain-containing protein [Mycolicibacterium sp. BiH015]MDA2895200.1 DUF2505 domain-containing protein [Mycolicibacterium sp. BiH015]